MKQKTKEELEKIVIPVESPLLNNSDDYDKDIQLTQLFTQLSITEATITGFSIDTISLDFSNKFATISTIQNEQVSFTNTSQQVNYNEIVTSSNDYVIIKGSPGIGKTTLVENLMYLWSKNQLWQKGDLGFHFDFVFLIYLNDLERFKDDKSVTVKKIMSFYYPDYDFNLPNTLLILDGFEELHGYKAFKWGCTDPRPYSKAVYDLFDPHNTQLQHCARIVTMRPEYCYTFIKTGIPGSIRSLEVTGFKKQMIEKYMEKFLGKQAEYMIPFIKDLPVVFDLMMIPSNCHSVCFLLKNTVAEGEEAESMMLEHTEASILCNMFYFHFGVKIDDLSPFNHERFDSEIIKIIVCLSKVCFQMVLKKRLYFSSWDFPEGINAAEMNRLLRSSGFVYEMDSTLPIKRYRFHHYFYHHFLVALYIFITSNTMENVDCPNINGFLSGFICSKSPQIVQDFTRVFKSKKPPTNTEYIIDDPSILLNMSFGI